MYLKALYEAIYMEVYIVEILFLKILFLNQHV